MESDKEIENFELEKQPLAVKSTLPSILSIHHQDIIGMAAPLVYYLMEE